MSTFTMQKLTLKMLVLSYYKVVSKCSNNWWKVKGKKYIFLVTNVLLFTNKNKNIKYQLQQVWLHSAVKKEISLDEIYKQQSLKVWPQQPFLIGRCVYIFSNCKQDSIHCLDI